jgi:GNAT superfamily N-acetyltransferase
VERLKTTILVTYMEATVRPQISLPLPEGTKINLKKLDCSSYLDLYRRVGAPVNWDSRLKLSLHDLDLFITSPMNKIYVLENAGTMIGLCEFSRQEFGNVELTHFGLVPEAKGKRLGLAFLINALQLEWEHGPKRVWLHTDEWDDPAAQILYTRSGFGISLQQYEDPEPL